MTQPPVALFARLDHSDWTANEWLPSVTLVDADCGPGPRFQAHLSPVSAPLLSSHAIVLLGNASVVASAYSWPATMLRPSKKPLPNELLLPLTKCSPQDVPASGAYGMFAYAIGWPLKLVLS